MMTSIDAMRVCAFVSRAFARDGIRERVRTARQHVHFIRAQTLTDTAHAHVTERLTERLDDDFRCVQDPDLEAIHAERMQSLKDAAEKRMTMERTGHGSLNEVEEKEFLPEVTTTAYVVAHFYHHEFERCRIMDKHLALLAKKYFDTKFIKVSAPDAPFFVTKLQIQVLPCVLFFRDGVCFDRLVGFEDVGGKDDYRTEKLENILLKAGVIALPEKHESDSEDEEEEFRREAMSRVIRGGVAYGSDDESSDFE